MASAPGTMDGQRLGVRLNPPTLGSHTDEMLRALGFGVDEVQALRAQKTVG
ncbi:MAG: hypothetical protein KGN32_06020 [Burkholderiales bacterium]|nr:hypothetical protein [Burkholderiales bacterium]